MSSKSLPTRDRILKSCQNLLETKGAAEVRMADIAKLAGVSRQALYLHFPNRAELLIATTRYLDEINGIGARVDKDVFGVSGIERLDGLVATWGDYIPKIYGVGKALLAIKDTDKEARAAWDDRMAAVRGLCEQTVQSLADSGVLTDALSRDAAVDMLWVLLSVRNWEQLTKDCGWSQAEYLAEMRRASRLLVVDER